MGLPGQVFGPIVWPLMDLYAYERSKPKHLGISSAGSALNTNNILISNSAILESHWFYTIFVPRLLFCPSCKHHYQQQLLTSPPFTDQILEASKTEKLLPSQCYEQLKKLPQWVLDRHNNVNQLSDKRQWTLTEMTLSYRRKNMLEPHYRSNVVHQVMELWAMEAFSDPINPSPEEQEQIKEFFQGNDFVFQFLDNIQRYQELVQKYPPVTTSREALGQWYTNIMNALSSSPPIDFHMRKQLWYLTKMKAIYEMSEADRTDQKKKDLGNKLAPSTLSLLLSSSLSPEEKSQTAAGFLKQIGTRTPATTIETRATRATTAITTTTRTGELKKGASDMTSYSTVMTAAGVFLFLVIAYWYVYKNSARQQKKLRT